MGSNFPPALCDLGTERGPTARLGPTLKFMGYGIHGQLTEVDVWAPTATVDGLFGVGLS